jgi:hypothetical protein
MQIALELPDEPSDEELLVSEKSKEEQRTVT